MNPKNKPNGHGALLAKGRGANGGTISSRGMGRAASVRRKRTLRCKRRGFLRPAGAEREACAGCASGPGRKHAAPIGLAPLPGLATGAATQTLKAAGQANATREAVPGLEPLPIDGEAFVDAVRPLSPRKAKKLWITQRKLLTWRRISYIMLTIRSGTPPFHSRPKISV